jgi:hypothetical protein
MSENRAADKISFSTPAGVDDSFAVERSTHILSGFVCRHRRTFMRLGAIETKFFSENLIRGTLKQPVFIIGLARAGSTLILEYCAGHDSVATHRYRDFPFLFTPVWWQRFLDSVPKRAQRPAERAHKDGMLVTAESPEAMEEMLWAAFFAHAHDPFVSNILDKNTSNSTFEKFYRDHIRKMLCIRGGSRYVCKNNYNVTRLEYLIRLFPDCRIVIPVRKPAGHIASLMKQHRLFCEGERRYRRSLEHMRRTGHYEFGLDRRPINAGDCETVKSIIDLWERGEAIRAWARYWAHIYRYIADTVDTHVQLKAASHIVRFEDLCEKPAESLQAVSSHCCLTISGSAQKQFASRIRYPDYYRSNFSDEDLAVIDSETEPVAKRFGY